MPYEFGYPSRLRAIHFGKKAATEITGRSYLTGSTGLADQNLLSISTFIRVPSAYAGLPTGLVSLLLTYNFGNGTPIQYNSFFYFLSTSDPATVFPLYQVSQRKDVLPGTQAIVTANGDGPTFPYDTWVHLILAMDQTAGTIDIDDFHSTLQTSFMAVNGVSTPTAPFAGVVGVGDDLPPGTYQFPMGFSGNTGYIGDLTPKGTGITPLVPFSSGVAIDVAGYQVWPGQYITDTNKFINGNEVLPPSVAEDAFGKPEFLFDGNAQSFKKNQGTGPQLSAVGSFINIKPYPKTVG